MMVFVVLEWFCIAMQLRSIYRDTLFYSQVNHREMCLFIMMEIDLKCQKGKYLYYLFFDTHHTFPYTSM